jgi:hypothetical protein
MMLTFPSQHCLRIDVPETLINPKPQKFVLCFSDDNVYHRAASAMKQAQFAFFDAKRLASQPDGAIQAIELARTIARASVSKSEMAFTRDLKVKEGDGDEVQRQVTMDGEAINIEPKSAGIFSKRTSIPILGLPVSFLSPCAISFPTRVAYVTLAFSNSRDRDVFAYNMFSNAKGDPQELLKSPVSSSVASTGYQPPASVPKRVDEEDLLLPFAAVIEKQGQCDFQIRPASDGTPHLYAMPAAESRATVGWPCGKRSSLSD